MSATLVQPSDLDYLGAFRLPDGTDDAHSWAWARDAVTYYPAGDPSGAADGHPGSIYGTGHAVWQYVSEVSIPNPVISPTKSLDDLNTAVTLQDFTDVRAGLYDSLNEILRSGMAYLPAQGDQATGKLHMSWGQHFQEEGSPELIPSHMWSELGLSDPQTQGAWWIDGQSIYSVNDYMFEIPEAWASTHATSYRLATGRYRDGGWSGQGPSLYAIAPWNEGNPPPPNTSLDNATLLHYDAAGVGEHTLNNYHHSDEWAGGEWLTEGDRSAVIFVGTKGTGDCWYGGPNHEWHHPDRGWWSDGFVGQILFYDPDDFAAVAEGSMEPYDPQPYATLNVDQYLYHVGGPQQKEHISGVCYDRENGLLYLFEPYVDNDKPIVHVFQIAEGEPGVSWRNPVNEHDVNGDGHVTSLDVLTQITYINAHLGSSSLPAPPESPPPYYDVNDDGDCTSLDVLLVIHHINSQSLGSGDGESVESLFPVVLIEPASTSAISTAALSSPPTSYVAATPSSTTNRGPRGDVAPTWNRGTHFHFCHEGSHEDSAILQSFVHHALGEEDLDGFDGILAEKSALVHCPVLVLG